MIRNYTHTPVRTCIGCRSRRPQHTLLRLRRRSDGQVVPTGRAASGRSTYLCASRECYDRALKRRAFSRALGGPRGLSVSFEGSNLWAIIERDVNEQVKQLQRTSVKDTGQSPEPGDASARLSEGSRMSRLLLVQQRLTESGKAGV